MMAVKSKQSASKGAKQDGNAVLCAILCYFIVGIVWYFVDEKMKKSSLARFHAKQGLVLLLAAIVVNIVGSLVFWIPFIGWALGVVVGLFFLILWIMGLVYSATGKETALPVLGEFAEKLSF